MTQKTFLENYYEECLERFRSKSVEELIESFNREVGSTAWTSARGAHLRALRESFEERNLVLDSTVFCTGSTSYARKIRLGEDKVSVVAV